MAASPPRGPPRVVVVSHLLPITLHRHPTTGQWSARWDEEVGNPVTAISRYAALGVRRLERDYLFVGSPPLFIPKDERPAVEAAIAAAGLRCALVYLDPNVAGRFYSGFCKATLWPTLHNVLDVYSTTASMGAILDREPTGLASPNEAAKRRASSRNRPKPSVEAPQQPLSPENAIADGAPQQSWQGPTRSWNPIEGQEETWQDYCEVNRLVAKAVVENYSDGDIVWVQHYHLLLVPSYLARKLRHATIGTTPTPAASAPALPAAPYIRIRARARGARTTLRKPPPDGRLRRRWAALRAIGGSPPPAPCAPPGARAPCKIEAANSSCAGLLWLATREASSHSPWVDNSFLLASLAATDRAPDYDPHARPDPPCWSPCPPRPAHPPLAVSVCLP